MISDIFNDDLIVIMAGGNGKRMESDIPKQLLLISHLPMITHLLLSSEYLKKNVLLIVGETNNQIICDTLQKYGLVRTSQDSNIYTFGKIFVAIIIQQIANGTGGALASAIPFLQNIQYNPQNNLIILSSDVPLISTNTIKHLINSTKNPYIYCSILAKETDDNYGYGRIKLDNYSNFSSIIEEVDCSHEESKIKLINTGIYCFKYKQLSESLGKLNCNNSQNEYYLTDCPSIILSQYVGKNPINIVVVSPDKYDETLGANTPQQLETIREHYLKKFTIESIVQSPENTSIENLNNVLDCLSQLTKTPYVDHKILLEHISDSPNRGKYTHVVKFDHRIIGLGSIIIENKIIRNMSSVGHIEDIVIHKDFRKYGMAKKLLNQLIDIGKQNNCYKIILNCSEEVIGFYEKVGFKQSTHGMRMDIH
jgi:NDP-sugar pyrophosphorylase family protein